MSKKFIGSEGINKFINILSTTTLFPKESITKDAIQELWEMCDKPHGDDLELTNWKYTLDEDNGIVMFNQFINNDSDTITIYPYYYTNAKFYKMNIGLCKNDWNTFMFSNKSNIKKVIFEKGIDMSNSTDLNALFLSCNNLEEIVGLNNLDTSNVTIFNSIFKYCSSLKTIDVSTFNTRNAENMSCLFMGCTNLKEIKGIENFKIEKSANTSSLFTDCKSLNNDTIKRIEKMDVGKSNCMNYTFMGCTSITSLDLTRWDISNVDSMYGMFKDCTNLKEIKVSRSKWVIKSGCNTGAMFDNCGCSEVTYVD